LGINIDETNRHAFFNKSIVAVTVYIGVHMGCGASSLDKVIAKQNGQLPLIIHSREKEEPADDTDTHNPEYSNRETSARSKLSTLTSDV
jgi:hypothetical protein